MLTGSFSELLIQEQLQSDSEMNRLLWSVNQSSRFIGKNQLVHILDIAIGISEGVAISLVQNNKEWLARIYEMYWSKSMILYFGM